MRHSLEGKLVLLSAGLIALSLALFAGLLVWLKAPLSAALAAMLCVMPIVAYAARRFMRPVTRTLQAVSDGIVSMKDRDFSVSIRPASQNELKALVESYNGLGEQLRTERQGLYQRELLLDTVIQATPLAMVLTNSSGRIVHSNLAARQTFLGGR